jgi:hypothetical protein
MALRKFKQFMQDYEARQLKSTVLGEEADGSDIADASTVIIGSELSLSERNSLCDAFINSIRRMNERGGTIMAIAVELE